MLSHPPGFGHVAIRARAFLAQTRFILDVSSLLFSLRMGWDWTEQVGLAVML
jgi:hypothetical protein